MKYEDTQAQLFRPNHHESGIFLAILLIPLSIVAFILFYDFFPPFCLTLFGLVLFFFAFLGLRAIWFHYKSFISLSPTSIAGHNGQKEFNFDWQELIAVHYIDTIEQEKGHWLIISSQTNQVIFNIDTYDVTAVRERLEAYAPPRVLEPSAYKRLDQHQLYERILNEKLETMTLPIRVSVSLYYRIIYVTMFLFTAGGFVLFLVNDVLIAVIPSLIMAIIFFYWILQGSGTVEFNSETITFNKIWGLYQLKWDEVNFLEMNSDEGWLMFHGENKQLGIPASGLWDGNRTQDSVLFLSNKIETYQLEVKKSRKAPYRFNKNTKVKS